MHCKIYCAYISTYAKVILGYEILYYLEGKKNLILVLLLLLLKVTSAALSQRTLPLCSSPLKGMRRPSKHLLQITAMVLCPSLSYIYTLPVLVLDKHSSGIILKIQGVGSSGL